MSLYKIERLKIDLDKFSIFTQVAQWGKAHTTPPIQRRFDPGGGRFFYLLISFYVVLAL